MLVTVAITMLRTSGLLGFVLLKGFWLMDSKRPFRYPRALLGLTRWYVFVNRGCARLLKVGRAGLCRLRSRIFGAVTIGYLRLDIIFGLVDIGDYTLE